MNIFEQASKQKFRFSTVRGEVTVEQLWDIPLTSNSGFDLDTIAKGVNTQLKAETEESFVATKSNPSKAKFEAMLELVKHVISAKLQQKEEASNRVKKAEERAKLIEVLERKQNANLENLDETEILKRIEQLA